MLKKIIRLVLCLIIPIIMMTGCNAPKKVSKPTHQETVSIDVNGAYTTKHDVALYLHTYHKLPKNFITKREARELGWQGGGLDGIKDGYCIGGDRYGNYEKRLPTNQSYHECDIETMHQESRGTKRLVYSNNFDIYYTEDHYNTFIKVYSGEGQ
ncbi:ribonuclease domain-containing protein [Sharpea azabuensis]|uniref:ribonuclease domain-containing protein n=1 Tax=Sharpea azabuensis TaxID=322505 RepID=UPI00240A9473|nr:ribonuclease domain-containing protein [Sharpea azabuensis]MDD6512688.1 ribonuclease domain-containing protein [Sharpea azabuensis]